MENGLSPIGQERYRRWHRFLLEKVPFLHEDSFCHAKDHCARVLLFCIRLSEACGLGEGETEVLCTAAVFHDCRRFDDGRDVGHGQRAAEEYRARCASLGLCFDARVAVIMAYHDRHDALGEQAISEHFTVDPAPVIRLYRIFKDADALDRFRFGPQELDERYLRTEEARSLIPFARSLFLGDKSDEGAGASYNSFGREGRDGSHL